MDTTSPTLEEVAALALQLSPSDKAELIARLATRLRYDIASNPEVPRRSLLGALAHLGPAPSAEDIDEMRHEAWGRFYDADRSE